MDNSNKKVISLSFWKTCHSFSLLLFEEHYHSKFLTILFGLNLQLQLQNKLNEKEKTLFLSPQCYTGALWTVIVRLSMTLYFVLEQLLSFVHEFFFSIPSSYVITCSHGFKSKNLFRFACYIAFVMSKNVPALIWWSLCKIGFNFIN